MDFEVTNVIDSPANRRRICIEKQVQGFPYFFIPTQDHIYEGFDAARFRHARDKAFAILSDYAGENYLHRRFIQNDTFIADTLEIALPRDIERDLGYYQHINITVVQLHGRTDPALIPEQAKEDEHDCMELMKDLYTKNKLSEQQLSFKMIEAMILQTSSFLKLKKPLFKTVFNQYGLVINFRSLHAQNTEMFTYALGIKHKRFQDNVGYRQAPLPHSSQRRGS